MSLTYLPTADPQVADAINQELSRQRSSIELIASENFTSVAVMEAVGSVLTNKYAEGYPGKRYYGGCEKVDIVENLARDRAKELFNCNFANVQPHCGANANLAAYQALINLGDTVLGLSLVMAVILPTVPLLTSRAKITTLLPTVLIPKLNVSITMKWNVWQKNIVLS